MECCVHSPKSHYNISGLDPNDAIQLLLTFTMTEDYESNQRVASLIVQELGYLALAIVQAGSYISKSCSFDEYLQIFQVDRAQLMQTHSVQTLDDYQLAVYTTWEISWKQLSATAASLLHLCAYLHYGGISKSIFQKAAAREHGGPFNNAKQFLHNFQTINGIWSDLKFHNIINELASYSLISIDGDGRTFSIHPLVHAWA
jgi:hypothetical protein